MSKEIKSRIIKGIPDLSDYLLEEHKVTMSRPTIMKYIENGLPCWFFCNTYHFHSANVDAFFRARTSKSIKNPPEEGEEINDSQ